MTTAIETKNAILTNRHDFLFLVEVTDGNPNGDPDAGNLPRIDPATNHGLITDVCFKRKIRNFVELFPLERASNDANGFDILIKQGAIIETQQKRATQEAGKNPEEVVKWLCREFYDVRTFGGVLGVGDEVMKGSAFGQVRGPVQLTFARSLHPIITPEVTITRCAVTKEADAKKERTMGHKYIVPYGLYLGRGYMSPAFAERTGFTDADLEVFFEALENMYEHDRSSARGSMIVRGLYDFEHVGTQNGANAAQNRRESRLGCAHAHQLFELVRVALRDGVEWPTSFGDYEVSVGTELPRGVVLHRRVG